MYKIVCLGCNEEFETSDKRRKYCSIKCANIKNQEKRTNYEVSKRVNKKCLSCEKEFYSKDKRAKFCGRSCAAHYNNILQGKKTEEEKQKISESLKEYRSSNKISQETKDKISASLFEYNLNNPKNTLPNKVKVCRQCDKVFYPDKWSRFYCSYECYNKSREGENKNEISYRTFLKILKRAFPNWSCPFCGWTHCFDVHHINGRKDNNFNSLIMLCPNHHSLAHLGKLPLEDMKQQAISTKISKDGLMKFYSGKNNVVNINFYRYKMRKEIAMKAIDDRRSVNLNSIV